MALGFFEHYAGDQAVAWSGGSEPGDRVNPSAIAAMNERGIDISSEFPKPWTDEIVRAADVVITMGCGDACPVFPGKRYEEWVLEDPAGKDVAAVRPVRDEIERRVLQLLDELEVPAAVSTRAPSACHRWFVTEVLGRRCRPHRAHGCPLPAADGRRRRPDRRQGRPRPANPALGLQVRSLEIFDQLGLVDAVLEQTRIAPGRRTRLPHPHPSVASSSRRWASGSRAVPRDLRPRAAAAPSASSRRVRRRLGATSGGSTNCVIFMSYPDGVSPGPAPVEVQARYVIAADGASSLIRKQLGVPFEGTTKPQVYFVADAAGHRPGSSRTHQPPSERGRHDAHLPDGR